MSDGADDKASWVGAILQSAVSYKRLILLILFVVVLLAAVIEYTVWRIPRGTRITFGTNGATLVYDSNRDLKATFHLHASSRWTNTGIEIPPKSAVQIRAAGRIHLAIHHLTAAAIEDTKPTFPWLSPEGEPFDIQRYKDVNKKSLLIMKDANVGCLLAALHSPGTQNETEPSLVNNPRPRRLYKIGAATTIQNTEETPLQLWLVINEMCLDPTDVTAAEKQYRVMDQSGLTDEDKATETKRWTYIRDNNYWDLWFDDNIGEFFVTIEQN